MKASSLLKKLAAIVLEGRERIVRNGKLRIDWSSYVSLNSEFEGLNSIKKRSRFSGKMGVASYIGAYCDIHANIGRFTSIAEYVNTNRGLHPYTKPYVSTSPMFFSTACYNGYSFAKEQKFSELRAIPEIGNDCWIGQGCFIAGGVKIGDGAVVLAGAYVVKDVPNYAIVGGVPAKIVKYRYDEETIALLNKIQWWNKDLEWIKENWDLFNNMDEFIEYHKNYLK